MKTNCRILLILSVLVCLFTIPAFASYDSVSKELSAMGLYNDNYAGFSSSAIPTREDAVVTLVSLIGEKSFAESQFSSGKTSCPFADVSASAKPYVAWLYGNKLANGKSATYFGASEPCDAKTYCTMALRALGYSEGSGGDFTYSDALTYAESVGVYSSMFANESFDWSQMALISYQLLAVSPKGSSDTLLDQLIANDLVDSGSAASTHQKISAYRSYLSTSAASSKNEAVAMSMKMVMSAVGSDSSENMEISVDISSLKVKLSETDFQMELIGTAVYEGETYSLSAWIKDGCMYAKLSGNITGTGSEMKIKQTLDSDTLDTIFKAVKQSSAYSQMASCPLYLLDSISATKNDTGTVYTMSMSFEDLSSFVPSMDATGLSGDMTFKINVGTDGALSSMTGDMNIGVEDESVSATFNVSIIGMGDKVTITYPDFTDYVEVSGSGASAFAA